MTKSNPLGPTGQRVAHHVAQLRRTAGLSRVQLADQLAHHGRPLSSTVLHRIENGGRLVDVDDLIALALVFDTDPLRLMFGNDWTANIDVTPTWSTSAGDAHLWAQGSTYDALGDTDQSRRVRALIAQLHSEIGGADRGQH